MKYKRIQLYKKIIWIGFGIFLIILVILVSSIKIIYPNTYFLDLSFSVSDVIQIGIIIVAITGPLVVNLLLRRIERPIIEIRFEEKKPNVFLARKSHFTSKFNTNSLPGVDYLHYCLGIKNIGLTKLSECEGVLTKIYECIGIDEYKEITDFIPVNLKWLSYFREEKIDINPEREYLLAIAFFNKIYQVNDEKEAYFRIFSAEDVIDKMIRLKVGTYKLKINIYSNNADMTEVILGLTFNVVPTNEHRIWEPKICMNVQY